MVGVGDGVCVGTGVGVSVGAAVGVGVAGTGVAVPVAVGIAMTKVAVGAAAMSLVASGATSAPWGVCVNVGNGVRVGLGDRPHPAPMSINNSMSSAQYNCG